MQCCANNQCSHQNPIKNWILQQDDFVPHPVYKNYKNQWQEFSLSYFVLFAINNKIISICLSGSAAAKLFETQKKKIAIIWIEKNFRGVRKPFYSNVCTLKYPKPPFGRVKGLHLVTRLQRRFGPSQCQLAKIVRKWKKPTSSHRRKWESLQLHGKRVFFPLVASCWGWTSTFFPSCFIWLRDCEPLAYCTPADNMRTPKMGINLTQSKKSHVPVVTTTTRPLHSNIFFIIFWKMKIVL